MGDPNPTTELKRGGNPAAIFMAKKYLKNPMGCIHCHDPHAAKQRVVRDALIEAVVDRREGLYQGVGERGATEDGKQGEGVIGGSRVH